MVVTETVFTTTQPRLRDRLCLLIRQHNLDPALVKAYAADFCGTATLKEASRELVESFIAHLADAPPKTATPWSANSIAMPTRGGRIMKRHIPGLHSREQIHDASRLGRLLPGPRRSGFYRWHPRRPFYFSSLRGPRTRSLHQERSLRPALLHRNEPSGNSIGFCEISAMTLICSARTKIDEKALLSLQGVLRISRTTFNGRSFLNLDGFAPAATGMNSPLLVTEPRNPDDLQPHTDYANTCAARAAIATDISMAGGRRKPRAAWSLAARLKRPWGPTSQREDPSAVLFKEWGVYRDVPL